jgi:hypothetical protein
MDSEEDYRLYDSSRYWSCEREDAPQDNTDHTSDTGEPVFLPFRMSCFVLSNLVVTAGMLTPGLGVRASNPPLQNIY